MDATKAGRRENHGTVIDKPLSRRFIVKSQANDKSDTGIFQRLDRVVTLQSIDKRRSCVAHTLQAKLQGHQAAMQKKRGEWVWNRARDLAPFCNFLKQRLVAGGDMAEQTIGMARHGFCIRADYEVGAKPFWVMVTELG